MPGTPVPRTAPPPADRRRWPALLTAVATAVTGTALAVLTAASPAQAACGTTNVALNRPATSSTNENSTRTAARAVDGSTATRWSSACSSTAT